VSIHETLSDGTGVRLSAPNGSGKRRWVRLASTGRTLGQITPHGREWGWEPSPAAFRGDGRPGHECDGNPADMVPGALLEGGTVAGTRSAVTRCLVDTLRVRQAPALGFGPHPEVSLLAVFRDAN